MLKKAPAVYCMKCTARANFGEKQQGVNKKRQIRKEAGERQGLYGFAKQVFSAASTKPRTVTAQPAHYCGGRRYCGNYIFDSNWELFSWILNLFGGVNFAMRRSGNDAPIWVYLAICFPFFI